jgi:predicted DsbA family dithiol-disulfide isomerase
VKYVVKDFPLESIHKLARKLAETSNCAAEQGKFWEMRDRFFADQKNLKLEDLPVHAQALGLQQEIFKQCLDGKVYASKISGDVKEAQSATVRSVPTFLLGFAEPQGKVRAVKMITGAQPYAVFKEAIDTLLSSQK